MPGRHRPAAEVRRDGLAAVLGPPLDHPAVRSTALIDVASGMVLATAGPRADPDPPADPELLGARHADLVRAAVALLGSSGGRAGDGGDGDGTDVLVDAGPAGHHVVRVLPDPHGGHLALTAVVVGTRRVAERVRRRLRRVPAAALTAVPVPGEPWHGPAEGPRPFRVAGSSGPPPPRQSQPQSQPQPPVRSWAPTGPPTDPAPGRRPGAPPPDRARLGTAPSAAPLLAPPPLRSPGPGGSAAGRPVPAAADPAMALLPGVRAGGPPPGAARSPAAALEAPAPVVRRLRPVDPPGGRPPVAAPPPSGPAPPAALPPPTGPRALPPAALPPAPPPPADGGGRGR